MALANQLMMGPTEGMRGSVSAQGPRGGAAGDWWNQNLPEVNTAATNLGAPGNPSGAGTQLPGGMEQMPRTIEPGAYNIPQVPRYAPSANTGINGGNLPGAPQGSAPQGGGDVQAFIQQWQASHSPSEGIEGLANALKQAGLGGERFMYGNTPSNNELVVNGQKFKVLGGEGTSGAYWYKPGSDDSPGGGAGTFGTGDLARGYGGISRAPTEQEALNSPGLKFAMGETQRAIERGAAGKGTLLGGGTLRDLGQALTGQALQGYGNLFNQQGQTFDRNYGVFRNNQSDIFNRYYNLAQLGAGSAQGAAS